MDKLNWLLDLSKACHVVGEPVRLSDSQVEAIAEAFRELEKERNAFESNYNGEIDLRKQIQNNWRRLAAASGWVDSRDQYAADNDLPRQFDSATETAKSWKQRAETAEAEVEDTDKTMRAYSDQLVKVTAELVAAQAQLAEIARKEPDYFLNRIESSDKWGPETELRIYESQLDASKSKDNHGGGIIELFTRPAPTTVPVDLVPDEEWFRSHVKSRGMSAMRREGRYVESATRFAHDIWYATQAEMLRRIEGLKK